MPDLERTGGIARVEIQGVVPGGCRCQLERFKTLERARLQDAPVFLHQQTVNQRTTPDDRRTVDTGSEFDRHGQAKHQLVSG